MAVDAAERDRRREHAAFLDSGEASARVRGVVAESWLRSAAAGVDPDANLAPVRLDAAELAEYRSAHPLSRVFPLLYDVLGRTAEDCDCVLAVGDADGQLLWVCGPPAVLRLADTINFVEGSVWDEHHAGTNAPGMALRLDVAVQVHSAEHFNRLVQPWSCAAAPIHDPYTQEILGLVDVTGGEDVASPQTLGMVRAAARMAEAELARIAAVEGHPAAQRIDDLWSPRGAADRPAPASRGSGMREPGLRGPGSRGLGLRGPGSRGLGSRGLGLRGLGRAECVAELGGRSYRLSPRHSEILVILADHPDGLTAEELEVEVYSDGVHSSTMRAELARLRALVGPDLVRSRPYMVTVPTDGDWQAVAAYLAAGRVGDALRTYAGPLLPQSQAPGIVARRELLQRQLRAAVLASGQAELMVAWTRSGWGADDLGMWHRQSQALPDTSPLRPLAAAEARRLERELGAPGAGQVGQVGQVGRDRGVRRPDHVATRVPQAMTSTP